MKSNWQTTSSNFPHERIFAGLYAFYIGLAVVLVTGFPFAPLVHWFLYRLHLETQDKSKPK